MYKAQIFLSGGKLSAHAHSPGRLFLSQLKTCVLHDQRLVIRSILAIGKPHNIWGAVNINI